MNPNITIQSGDYVTIGAPPTLPHGSVSGSSAETVQAVVESHGVSGWEVVANNSECDCCSTSDITDDDGDVELTKDGYTLFVLPNFLTLDGEAPKPEVFPGRDGILRIIGLAVGTGVISTTASVLDRDGQSDASRAFLDLGALVSERLTAAIEPFGVTSVEVSDLMRRIADGGPESLFRL